MDAEFDFECIVIEKDKQARKKHRHKKHRCDSAAAREFDKACR